MNMVVSTNEFRSYFCFFNTTDEKNSFSNTVPGFWFLTGSEGTVDWLNDQIKLRSQNDIYVKEVEERGKNRSE